MIAVITFIVLVAGPAIGGAVLLHLWHTRPHRVRFVGLQVGSVPMRARRWRQPQAVRVAGLSAALAAGECHE